MKRRTLGIALALALVAVPALCQEELCSDAAIAGQRQRRAGKLVDARAQFVACSQSTCVHEVADRCMTWLHEVDALAPSIALVAHDADGRDIAQGRVLIDEVPIADGLSGRRMTLDPGTHRIRLESDAGAREETVVLREGEQDRIVTLAFPRRPPPRPSSAMLTSALVIGGVGVVATGFFVGFGIRGISDRAQSGCDTGCSAADYDRVRTEFLVADVALGVALGSLAVAAVLFFLRPRAASAVATGGPSIVF